MRMGWLRLVGSLKLYVSFAEYRHFYRALLQKRPIILRSLVVGVTPYSQLHLECRPISISNLNFIGLFSTERIKRDIENNRKETNEIPLQKNVAKEMQRSRKHRLRFEIEETMLQM